MTASDKGSAPARRPSQDDGLRARAIDAYDAARDRAASAGRTASDTIADAPMIALAGGLAIGALAAALLPKTRIEDKLLGPTGERLTGAGRAAIDAARDAGRDKLNELNLTREAGKGMVQSVLDGLGETARASGQAALGAVRDGR